MAEDPGVEPGELLSQPYGLANHCICHTAHLPSGGGGETRTHTPIAGPSVFKTAAAMPIRLTPP